MSNISKASSKTIYSNPYFSVSADTFTRSDSTEDIYYIIHPGMAVFIIALNKKQEFVLVRLFRHTTQCDSIEVPAGGTDGQLPLAAAKRELQEETGYIARSWKLLGKLQMANGMSDQYGYVYLATQLEQTKMNQQAEEGITDLITASFEDICQIIKTGEMTDAQSITAITLAAIHIRASL